MHLYRSKDSSMKTQGQHISLIQKGDFMCTFDLKSGYHHIDIHMNNHRLIWGSAGRVIIIFSRCFRLGYPQLEDVEATN